MNNMDLETERRHSRRFAAKDGIVHLDKSKYYKKQNNKTGGKNRLGTLSSPYMKIGNLVNIGEGGIAFLYFSTNGKIETLDVYDISIEFKGKGMLLKKIAFKTRDDFPLNCNTIGLRQRCVKFGSIEKHQAIRLSFFLQHLDHIKFRNTPPTETNMHFYN